MPLPHVRPNGAPAGCTPRDLRARRAKGTRPEQGPGPSWFQYIIEVHRHLKITDEQRDRFVALYLEALDEAGLPHDQPFREAVRSHVEFGAHVAQQNSWAESDKELHPIRNVPHWEWSPTAS